VCEVPGWGLQLGVDRVLGEMHGLGLHETELGAIGWLPTEADALRATLDAHQLRVVAAFVPLVCHEPERRHQALASATAMAELLAAVGADTFVTAVVSDPSDWRHETMSEAQWDHVFAVLDDVEGITSEHHLRQVVHPHVNTLVETGEDVDRLLEGSTVPICLDTGHLTIGGAHPLALAEQATSRVGLVHLKDVRTAVAGRLNAGELDLMAAVQAGLFAPLGDGDVPIAEIVTTLEGNGYAGRYVLEQDVALTDGEPPAGEGPVRDVAKSVTYLRTVESTLGATLRAGVARRGPELQPPPPKGDHEEEAPLRSLGARCVHARRRRVHGRRRRRQCRHRSDLGGHGWRRHHGRRDRHDHRRDHRGHHGGHRGHDRRDRGAGRHGRRLAGRGPALPRHHPR
jgi:inosose dehydratase